MVSLDGRGKKIRISSSFMGATKQLPCLFRELRNVMPKLEVSLILNDFHGNGKGAETLKMDLDRIDPTLNEYYCIIHNDTYFPLKNCVDLEMCEHDKDQGNVYRHPRSSEIIAWIDPLKFERRPLLSKHEQKELARKYFVDGSRVVVAGSIGSLEAEEFSIAIKYTRTKSPRTKFLIVPRTGPTTWIDRLEREGLRPALDVTLTKKYDSIDAVIVTENGILQDLYSICDTAFIGDTLWTTPFAGGQNPLEPAFYGKRIVSGKLWGRNKDAFEGLGRSGLLVEVGGQRELSNELAKIVSAADLYTWQKRANQFIDSRQGAAREYALKIRKLIYEL